MVKCENCKFWVPDEDEEGLGFCQIYPPTIGHDGGTCFPHTHKDWACGEGTIENG